MSADDQARIARVLKGDNRAFSDLVREYQRRVYATAFHIMGNHADADDVVQEAFVRAYRGLSSFDGRSELYTWLYRITVNTALNHLRTRKRLESLWDPAERDEVAAGEASQACVPAPSEHAELSDEVRRTLAAMAGLSPTLRVTLALAVMEGLSYHKISKLLDIPEGTVAWRINEARRQLRGRLCSPEDD